MRLPAILATTVAMYAITACTGAGYRPAITAQSSMDATSQSGDLLYVTLARKIRIYSYPQLKFVTQFDEPQGAVGLCSNLAGDVFVTNITGQSIFKYAHGATKPSSKLAERGWSPQGCSTDPNTGNLAVANYCQGTKQGCTGSGNIAIFSGAKGKATTFSSSTLSNPWYCAYDDASNLYVLGSGGSSIYLAKLAKRAKALKIVSLDVTLSRPAGVQWDGQYLAASSDDGSQSVVRRFKIEGYKGTQTGTVEMNGVTSIGQPWIQDGQLIVPNGYYQSNVSAFAYPQGGDATHVIEGPANPLTVTVSVSPSK